MILVADSKQDWPFTPAFPQVYVDDAQSILDKASQNGSQIITEVSDFYGGLKLARFKDPWSNIWWLFEKADVKTKAPSAGDSNTDRHDEKPSYIYTTILDAMKNLEQGK